jgi:hypothetical protein
MSEFQDCFEQHVRSKLESSFGKAVAMLILASASNATGASMIGIGANEYSKLCEAIARDQRVVDMWGASGAQDALRQWKSAGGVA